MHQKRAFCTKAVLLSIFGSIYVVKINYRSVWDDSLDWADRECNLTGLTANFLASALVRDG